MEFLLTYGWAIMVVLLAIGSLSYFGVLNPDNFVPRRCALEPGIGCMDFKVQEDSATLVLRNGRGEDIDISGIKIGNCTGTVSGFLKNGEQNTFIIGGCSNIANEKFIGSINITYKGETGLVHKNKGNIVGKTESGCVQCACENTDTSCGNYPLCSNCNSQDNYGANYCSGNNVVRDFNDYSCSTQQCVLSSSQELVEDCSVSGKICQNGSCVDTQEYVQLTCQQFQEDSCLFLFWLCDSVCVSEGYDLGELGGFCFFGLDCNCYNQYETQCLQNPTCGNDDQVQQNQCNP